MRDNSRSNEDMFEQTQDKFNLSPNQIKNTRDFVEMAQRCKD